MGFLFLGMSAGGIFFISQSSLVAVERIEVEGNRVIPSEEILDRAGPFLRGQSLLKPSFNDAQKSVLELPFAESVEIDRDFPHTIYLRIREYRPFVNLKGAGSLVFIISAEGKVLLDGSQADPSLPVVLTRDPCETGTGTSVDCQEAKAGIWFLANIPVNFNYEFSSVNVAGDDITALTKSGVNVHFGSLDDYDLKFEVLRQLLARSSGMTNKLTVDVSVPERPVTKDNNVTTTRTQTTVSGAGPGTENRDGAAADETLPEQTEAVVEEEETATVNQTGAPATDEQTAAEGTG